MIFLLTVLAEHCIRLTLGIVLAGFFYLVPFPAVAEKFGSISVM